MTPDWLVDFYGRHPEHAPRVRAALLSDPEFATEMTTLFDTTLAPDEFMDALALCLTDGSSPQEFIAILKEEKSARLAGMS